MSNQRLNHTHIVKLTKFLMGMQTDGKINLKVGDLTTKMERFLDYPVTNSATRRLCDDLEIEIIRNVTGGKRKSAAVAALETRVAVLEDQVKYLMGNLCTPKERELVLHPFPNAEVR